MKNNRLLPLLLALTAVAASAQSAAPKRIVSCVAQASMEQCRAAAGRMGGSVVRELPLIHAVVVETPAMFARFSIQSAALPSEVARVDEDRKVHWLNDVSDFSEPAELADLQDAARQLQRQQAQIVASAASDPRIPWGVARVGAPQEWKAAQGDGAVVGVIDTGIDATHPDLQGQVVGGVNLVDATTPNAWADDEGHGTHVSGTIAARGQGLFGVAPKAKLYAIKVLDSQGNGDYSTVIAGIQWAMNHGIKIVNMSLGASEGSDPLHRAVQAAVAAGVTVVAAAGNTGGAVGFPGAYPEVIAVGACDESNRVAPFSSRGPQVSFIAPGVNILSARMGGGYTTMSGTSMATPHVAGLAALAWSLGVRDPKALRAMLSRAARPLAGVTSDEEGSGMILAGNFQTMAGGAMFAQSAPSTPQEMLALAR